MYDLSNKISVTMANSEIELKFDGTETVENLMFIVKTFFLVNGQLNSNNKLVQKKNMTQRISNFKHLNYVGGLLLFEPSVFDLASKYSQSIFLRLDCAS